MTLTGPQKYPGADISHWYEKAFPGDSMESNVGVVHTTEGATLPTYSGGAVAPNFTLMPDFASKTLEVYQHFGFDVSSRALVNAAGGVQTNTLNVVQFELVGTCDPKTHKDWNDKKVQHIYWPAAPDWALLGFAKVVRWAYDNHAVPMTSAVTWKAYPDSYGAKNGVRLSNTAWTDYRGWLGHQHVPENLHGDPGAMPMGKVLAYAKAKSWVPSAPASSYAAFPGAAWFTRGRKSPVVAAMHDRLVAVGCNRYASSANKDVIGSGDEASYEAWQRKCGFSGAAAKWPPGKGTWDKLKVHKP